MLLNDQGFDQAWQLAWLQKEGRVSGSASAAPRDDVEVVDGERLVEEYAAGSQELRELAEDRAIEEAHADDRTGRPGADRKGAHVGRDAAQSRKTRHRGSHGSGDEVDDDHAPPRGGKWGGMAARPAGNVDDERIARHGQRAIDDPRRRRTIELLSALGVACLPMRAVVARSAVRSVVRGHR